jgi:hypothetical protein
MGSTSQALRRNHIINRTVQVLLQRNAAVLHYGTTKIRLTYEQPCAVGQKNEPAGTVAVATIRVARCNHN